MRDQRLANTTPGIRAESFDDGVVLFHPRTEEIHLLDRPAALVWWAVGTSGSEVDAVIAAVAAAVKHDAGIVADAVIATLETFAEKQVIELVDVVSDQTR